jgi:hypothetical protein
MATATKPAWSTKTRIFPNAGKLTLITHEADGSNTTTASKIYTSDRSIVDSITTKFSTTSEDMNDGNAFDPAATHITGRNVEVAVVLNTYDPILYQFAASAAAAHYTDEGYILKIGEEYTIDASAGTVALPTSAINADGVCLVRSADGTDYTKISEGTPATGQYSVDAATATFTFAATDKGKVVIITAEYACEKLSVLSVESQPTQNVYTLIADGKNCDKDENDELADNFIIDSCKIKGDLQPPAKQKNYSSWTVTFGLVKPRAGAKAFTMKTGSVSARASG